MNKPPQSFRQTHRPRPSLRELLVPLLVLIAGGAFFAAIVAIITWANSVSISVH